MSRQRRIWVAHHYYHVISRGNHRENIFRDAGDFSRYLNILGFSLNYFPNTPYELNCYCLMDNHIHLLIRCSEQSLSCLISKINWYYAMHFNKKYHYTGHLFEERFFSELISDEGQLLRTSRYIHLNPVRAGMVASPEDYKYSSYRSFIGLETHPLVQSHAILQYFSDDPHQNYQAFVYGDSHENIQSFSNL